MFSNIVPHWVVWRVSSLSSEAYINFSEYLKSRLMNTDSRFRKNPEFVFYYLWQKELRELSSEIYNVLKSSSRRSHTVKQFVQE